MKSLKTYVLESLKNPYINLKPEELKRKLDSFKDQLNDLTKKRMNSNMGGHKNKEIDKEINNMKNKIILIKNAQK